MGGGVRERAGGRGGIKAGGLVIPVSVISPKHPASHLPRCHIEITAGSGFLQPASSLVLFSSAWQAFL